MDKNIDEKLLGVNVHPSSLLDILEQIKKDISSLGSFYHVVSLNPEILRLTTENNLFKKIVETAQIQIVDGVGVQKALEIKYGHAYPRVTGVDLMTKLLDIASERSIRVLLIGGNGNLANELANCYQEKYPKSEFFGLEGYKSISNPTQAENEAIFSIVAVRRPHFIFAAFGSPQQEEWFYQNQDKLVGSICMGVGGSFDFLSMKIPRAPLFLRQIGLEWLFRLVKEPWRWRRQLRLISFMIHVTPDILFKR